MNALIVINSNGQDQELGVAFEAEMKNRQWFANILVPSVFTRKFDKQISRNEIQKNIQMDINAAVIEAEWSEINFVFTLSNYEPVLGKSSS